jgi:hypothetical protein
MAKESYYFSHDFEPTSDPKMLPLVGEYGAIGYGIYWRLVEMLHSAPGNKLEQKEYVFMGLAKQMLTPVEQVKAIITFCVEVCSLFYISDNFICCNRVFKNIEKRKTVSEQRSLAGKASAEKRKTQGKSTNDKQKATGVKQKATKERKGKEIKVNYNKEIAEQSSAVHKNCMALYATFIQMQTGSKAQIDAAGGKALNTIINYLRSNLPQDMENKDDEVLGAWEKILRRYVHWEPFHQNQLKLTQISSNLINIINAIKKHSASPPRSGGQGMSDADYNKFIHGDPQGVTGNHAPTANTDRQ